MLSLYAQIYYQNTQLNLNLQLTRPKLKDNFLHLKYMFAPQYSGNMPICFQMSFLVSNILNFLYLKLDILHLQLGILHLKRGLHIVKLIK